MSEFKVAHCFGNVQVDENGHWHTAKPVTFNLGNGAVGVTEFSQLLELDENRLVNPMTGHEFVRTRAEKAKGSHRKYFNRETSILVNCWLRSELPDEEYLDE